MIRHFRQITTCTQYGTPAAFNLGMQPLNITCTFGLSPLTPPTVFPCLALHHHHHLSRRPRPSEPALPSNRPRHQAASLSQNVSLSKRERVPCPEKKARIRTSNHSSKQITDFLFPLPPLQSPPVPRGQCMVLPVHLCHRSSPPIISGPP